MTDIPINDVTRRVQFTGNTTTGPFAFTFNILTASDIDVYKNDTLQTLTTHYTVSINANGTGSVTLTSALVATDVLTIIGGRAIARTTDFVTAGDLLASSLNEQLDSLVIMSQQLSERIDRTIIANPGDNNVDLTLPVKADRASKIVAFDTNGDLSLGTSSSLSLTLDTVDINTITTNLIDGVGGDLIIKPFGSQVNIVGTSGEQRITFSAVTSPTMTMFSADGNSIGLALPSGNPTAARTIRFPDADGNVALTNQNTLTPTGDFTVDASGDIILDADGAQVYFKDAGTTNFTFNLGSVPQIQANGTGLMIQNSSSSIDFKAASGLYEFLSSTGDQVVQLHGNTSDPAIKFYKTSNTLKLNAPSSITGTRTITLPDASGSVMLNVVEDTSPQLGGNLDLNGRRIQDDTQVYIEGTNSADIELQAAGGQVNILGTAGQQRITFDNAATPSMDTYGAFSIDGNDTITINSTGDFTVDSSGDIILDADGGDVYLKDNGTTQFTFTMTGNPTLLSSQNGITIKSDSSGDIMLQPQGGQVMLLGTSGEQRMNLNNDATPSIQIYQNSNNLTLDVATLTATRTLTLPDATDTLVGKATTDTLTNKTLTSAVLNSTISGTSIKDEDDMSSDSASHLATQQSIKAYVDANAGSGNLTTVLTSGNATGGNNIVFGDSSGASDDRLVFGAGSDLSIYSDGTTGQLDGDVNVTGTLTADGLTVDTTDQVIINHSGDGGGIRIDSTNATNTGSLRFGDVADNYIGALEYNHTTDSMSMYVNNATALTIDSSQNVGIGRTSLSIPLEVKGRSADGRFLRGTDNGGTDFVDIGHSGSLAFIDVTHSGGAYHDLAINTGGSEAMHIDSSQRVGISTSSPTHDLTVGDASASDFVIALRGGVGGFLGWDDSANSTILQAPNTRSLAFRVNSDTFGAGTLAATIDSSGHLLVGTSSTVTTGSEGVEIRSDFGYIKTARNNTGAVGHMNFYNPNGNVGSITTSGSSTAYNTSSDYRLKENVVNLTGATERLKQLEPKRFNFIVDADTTVDGFLAHEVSSIVPEAVTGTKDEVDADGNPEYQGIDQSKLVPLLVATIKELEARITALEAN